MAHRVQAVHLHLRVPQQHRAHQEVLMLRVRLALAVPQVHLLNLGLLEQQVQMDFLIALDRQEQTEVMVQAVGMVKAEALEQTDKVVLMELMEVMVHRAHQAHLEAQAEQALVEHRGMMGSQEVQDYLVHQVLAEQVAQMALREQQEQQVLVL